MQPSPSHTRLTAPTSARRLRASQLLSRAGILPRYQNPRAAQSWSCRPPLQASLPAGTTHRRQAVRPGVRTQAAWRRHLYLHYLIRIICSIGGMHREFKWQVQHKLSCGFNYRTQDRIRSTLHLPKPFPPLHFIAFSPSHLIAVIQFHRAERRIGARASRPRFTVTRFQPTGGRWRVGRKLSRRPSLPTPARPLRWRR